MLELERSPTTRSRKLLPVRSPARTRRAPPSEETSCRSMGSPSCQLSESPPNSTHSPDQNFGMPCSVLLSTLRNSMSRISTVVSATSGMPSLLRSATTTLAGCPMLKITGKPGSSFKHQSTVLAPGAGASASAASPPKADPSNTADAKPKPYRLLPFIRTSFPALSGCTSLGQADAPANVCFATLARRSVAYPPKPSPCPVSPTEDHGELVHDHVPLPHRTTVGVGICAPRTEPLGGRFRLKTLGGSPPP